MPRLSVDSPLGPLTLVAEDGALTFLDRGTAPPEGDDPVLIEAARQLAAYFAGRLERFDLPLRLTGTPFQKRVWQAMCEIPRGSVATYGDLARRVGSVARAVGGACGANPLPIIVPCHRVVGASGRGGFSGFDGRTTKDWLLRHEGVLLA